MMKITHKIMLIMAVLAAVLFVLVPVAGAADKTAKPAVSAAPAASQTEMAQEEITVSGTVVETKDKDGKISGCMLEEANGQSMMLSNDAKGMELQKMAGKKVKVMGTLQESMGKKTITVTEFEALE
jgi:hypothetical protein